MESSLTVSSKHSAGAETANEIKNQTGMSVLINFFDTVMQLN
jgi:hypothetical protein